MEQSDYLEVNTKGLCLLCVSPCSSLSSPDSTDQYSHSSFKDVMKYLKIEITSSAHFSSSILKPACNDAESFEVKISLCDECTRKTAHLCRLYHNLEKIHLQLDQCLKSVYHSIKNGEKDAPKVQEYERRMSTKIPLGLINASIAETLRKKTLERCLQEMKPLTKAVIKKENEESKTNPSQLQVNTTGNFGDLNLQFNATKTYPGQTKVQCNEPEVKLKIVNAVPKDEQCIPMDTTEAVVEEKPSKEQNRRLGKTTTSAATASAPINSNADTISTTSTAKMRFSDTEAPGSLDTSICLSRHSRQTASLTANSQRRLECSECGKSFKALNYLVRHRTKFHSGESSGSQLQRCNYCRKSFKTLSSFTSHLKLAHPVETFCKELPKGIKKQQFDEALKKAMGSHMHNEDFREPMGSPCPNCPERYSTTELLKLHLLENHFDKIVANFKTNYKLNQGEEKAVSVDRKVFVCPHCNVKYLSEDSLLIHLNVHSDVQRDK